MKKNLFRLSLLISLLTHFLVAGLVWVDPFKLSLKRPKRSVEVEVLSPEQLAKILEAQKQADPLKGQIVDQDEKALNDEIPENSKYLSRHNQKVERETRAELNDRFRNSTGGSGPAQAKQEAAEKTQEQEADVAEKQDVAQENQPEEPPQKDVKDMVTNQNGIKGIPDLKNFKPTFKLGPRILNQANNMDGGGDGPSATDDHIQAPKGMQTLLSTREFVYYSYYSRIKDKLRQYWEPKIKEKMERVMRQGRTIASSSNRITKTILILDATGKLVRVQVISESGVRDLDDAAVEAFKAAAPFPNPPKGIVEEDGLIRIRWDFILEAASSDSSRFGTFASLDRAAWE